MGLVEKALMEKLKEAAQQALQQAQDGMAQGQAKLDSYQLKRQSDAMLRDLGAAYYAEHRGGGASAAVGSALAALDSHVAQHGPIDTGAGHSAPPSTPPSSGESSGPSNAPQADPSPGPSTSGNYSLDDV